MTGLPRPGGDRTARAAALATLLMVLFAIAWVRLGYLQLHQTERFRELSDENSIRLKVVPAPRGQIVDRKGRLLADSYALFALTLDAHRPAFERHPQLLKLTLARLAPLLGQADSALFDLVERERKRSMRPIRLVPSADLLTLSRIEEHRDELPGVEIETVPVRHYPYGTLAAHVLGYSSEISDAQLAAHGESYEPGDLVGQSGLESAYEPWLRGRDGESLVEVSAAGRVVGEIRDRPTHRPQPGRTLGLTLDLNVQQQAEAALAHWERAAIVALDPNTGAILALASKPAYDPNEFSHGITAARWKEIELSHTFPLLDRAVQSGYPPGSTFKLVTAAAALRDGRITTDSHMPAACGGAFAFGRTVFHCMHHHGSLGLHDAIEQSCDVYFYQVGLRTGLDPMMREARALGLGEVTGVDLPGEKRGFVPSSEWFNRRYGRRGWTRAAAINLSIGQGELLVTPLQLALLAAQIGNGGRRVRPYLVETIREVDGHVVLRHRDAARDGTLGLPPEQIKALQDAMEAVVEEPGGTGSGARVAGLRVAGKTGTAQNPHGQDHAVFMCYAPADHPKIAVGIVVENGGHGGTAAAPVARRVIAAYLAPGTLKPEELAGTDTTFVHAGADSNATD